jgi:hypothetical protein
MPRLWLEIVNRVTAKWVGEGKEMKSAIILLILAAAITERTNNEVVPDTKGNQIFYVNNVLGQLVKTIAEGEYDPGYYSAEFNAGRFASGMYIYRLGGSKVNIVKKMMYVK